MRLRVFVPALLLCLASRAHATPVRYTAQFSADGSLQGVPFAGPEAVTLTGYGDTLNSSPPGGGTRYVFLDSFYVSIGDDATLPTEGPAYVFGAGAGYGGLGSGGGGITFYIGGLPDPRVELFADLTLATVTASGGPAYVTTFQTTGGPLTLDVPYDTPVLFNITLNPTPEPSAVLLLGTGVAGGVGVLRRHGKRSRGR